MCGAKDDSKTHEKLRFSIETIGFHSKRHLLNQQFKISNPNISMTKKYFFDQSKVLCFLRSIYEKSTKIYEPTKNIWGQIFFCRSGLDIKKSDYIYIYDCRFEPRLPRFPGSTEIITYFYRWMFSMVASPFRSPGYHALLGRP